MKPQNLGSAPFLMKMDLAELICRSQGLPLVYVPMFTDKVNIQGKSCNFRNYRLGSLNISLKEIASAPQEDAFHVLAGLFDHFAQMQSSFRIVTGVDTYKEPEIDWSVPAHSFNHETRQEHLTRFVRRRGRKAPSVILLDPEVGLVDKEVKIASGKAKKFLIRQELKELQMAAPDSIFVVSQSLANIQVTLEDHSIRLHKVLEQPILVVGDEVLQSAVMITMGSHQTLLDIEKRLLEHLGSYKQIPKSRFILWGRVADGTSELIPIGNN